MSSALHRELLSQAHDMCARARRKSIQFFSILWRMVADGQYLRQGRNRRWWRYEERLASVKCP
jgi:hypothetical protein